jgi:PKD repeat protein
LFSEKDNSSQVNNPTGSESTENIINVNPIELPQGTVIIKDPGDLSNSVRETVRTKNERPKNQIPGKEVKNQLVDADRKPITPAGISEQYSKKALLTDPSANAGKLQGKFLNGESLFESSALTGCVPLKLQFNITGTSFDSCNWTFGDGGFSNKRNPEWIFDLEGEYKVVLNLYGAGKLLASSSKIIMVNHVSK